MKCQLITSLRNTNNIFEQIIEWEETLKIAMNYRNLFDGILIKLLDQFKL